MTQTIGIFGLGLMGSAMATRLKAAGFKLIGFDPAEERRAAFEGLGGRPADPAEVWTAGTILSAVFDTDQLADLIESAPEGTGATLVSVSTVDPERMPGLGERAAAKGLALIEAPVSGSSREVALGKAILMVGGDAEVARGLDPVFAAIARAHFHVGGIGSGARAKLAINLVLGLNRAAVAEGLVFARALGLDPEAFLALARESAAASAVMDGKGDAMVARNFEPMGRIAQSAKDFALIREAAAERGHALPFAATYAAMMDDCLAAGEGDLDNAAIILAVERMRGER